MICTSYFYLPMTCPSFEKTKNVFFESYSTNVYTWTYTHAHSLQMHAHNSAPVNAFESQQILKIDEIIIDTLLSMDTSPTSLRLSHAQFAENDLLFPYTLLDMLVRRTWFWQDIVNHTYTSKYTTTCMGSEECPDRILLTIHTLVSTPRHVWARKQGFFYRW
jgi:hypothetical protein